MKREEERRKHEVSRDLICFLSFPSSCFLCSILSMSFSWKLEMSVCFSLLRRPWSCIKRNINDSTAVVCLFVSPLFFFTSFLLPEETKRFRAGPFLVFLFLFILFPSCSFSWSFELKRDTYKKLNKKERLSGEGRFQTKGWKKTSRYFWRRFLHFPSNTRKVIKYTGWLSMSVSLLLRSNQALLLKRQGDFVKYFSLHPLPSTGREQQAWKDRHNNKLHTQRK